MSINTKTSLLAIERIFAALQDVQAILTLQDGELKLRAPAGALSTDLVAEIKAHKQALIEHLRNGRAQTTALETLTELTEAQSRLWLADRISGQTGSFNAPAAFRILGELDTDLLEACLGVLVARHVSLRSRIVVRDGRPHQEIDSTPFQLHKTSISCCIATEEEIRDLVRDLAYKPIDLEHDRPFRAHLLKVTETDHVLIQSMHHVMTDEASVDIINGELWHIYEQASDGRPGELPALELDFHTYARLSRRPERSAEYSAQLTYWTRKLADLPADQNLPYDHPRPPVASNSGQLFTFPLPKPTAERIKALAAAEGATPYMGMLAALHGFLHRVTHDRDIVVGTPVSLRTRPEHQTLVGFLVNMLPIRTRFDDTTSFLDTVRNVQTAVLDAFDSSEIPFGRIVDAVASDRKTNRHPIFGINFTYRASEPQHEVSGLDVREMDIFSTGSKFDLSFFAQETSSGFKMGLEYASDLFDEPTVRQLCDNFVTFIGEAISNPGQPVRNMRLLDASAERKLLDWAGSFTPYPINRSLGELFGEVAALLPHAIAVQQGRVSISYRELDSRSNRLAQYLLGLGVRAEMQVGLCMPRSVETVVAMLAIAKIGAAYIPLDPVYPAERLAIMLEAVSMDFLISSARADQVLPVHFATVIDIDQHAGAIAHADDVRPLLKPDPSRLLYVMFTSGSTGVPNPVGVEQRGVIRLVRNTNYVEITPSDTIIQLAPLAFDASTFEIWGALLNGARLVLFDSEHHDPKEIIRHVEAERVTIMFVTTALFHRLVEQGIHRLDVLRLLLTGGEIIGADQVRQAIAALPRTVVIACYGPTEATTFSSCMALATKDFGATVPIGRSISNSTAYVLDEQLDLAPVGVTGELYLGGDGLARGYLGKQSLTAKKFVPNPFRTSERMYRTGDLARMRADGVLEFVGRRDHQIKIRGFRIELAEIDAALLRAEDVTQVVTILREDTPGDRRLVAYVTVKPETTVSPHSLREGLKAKLPGYMIPTAILVLDSLPLNTNGKIDRLRLPKPSERLSNALYASPRNEVERQLCETWANVLCIDQVGIDDNFFDIGGDSIIALRVQYECRQLGHAYSLRDLFVARTIRQLSELVQQIAPESRRNVERFDLLSEETRSALETRPNLQDAYPLSRLQAGMLFHNYWSTRGRDYHEVLANRMQRPLAETTLRQAVQACVDRHDVLRTYFELAAFEEPVQCVLRACIADVSPYDWTKFDSKFHKRMLDQFVAAEARRPFDLEHAPAVRFFAMKLSEHEFYFVISIHHAIIDGWSMATVLREIYENYKSILETDYIPKWPELPHRYRDFISLEQDALKSGEGATMWADAIEFGRIYPLAVSESTDTTAGEDGIVHEAVELEQSLASKIAETANRLSVPPKSVFLAAHLQALKNLSGGNAITTGLVIHARPEGERFDGVVGLFLNTVPVCLEESVIVIDELPARAYELELEAMRHRHYPAVEIFRKHGGRNALQTAFNFTNFHVLTDASENLKIHNESFAADATIGLGIHVTFDMGRQRCELALSYRHSSIGATVARRYLTEVREMLSLISNGPTESLTTALQPSESDDSLQPPPTPAVVWQPPFRAPHEMFSEWVRINPEALALEMGLQRLTYGELDHRSDQLANALRSDYCIGPEKVVGVALAKGVEAIVALLAIHKAGAAYMPLDPSLPPDRLRTMARQTNVATVLTRTALWTDRHPWSEPSMNGSSQSIADYDSIMCVTKTCPHHSFVLAKPGKQGLAGVIHTSGTTGIPKAIMLTYEGLHNLIVTASDRWNIDRHSKVLHLAALNFDISLLETLNALCNGASLVIVDTAKAPPGDTLRQLLVDSAVTHAAMTPTVLSLMQPEGVKALAHLVIGGETCSPELARTWAKGRHLYASYGPAECTVAVTLSRLHAFEEPLPLGNHFPGTAVHLLSPDLTPVPIGAPGEIYISGVGLARGYMNAPCMTALRFIPSPFGCGERLYRTGDFARRRPDNSLEYIGRQDDQVKLRGVRFELGEVNVALQSLPGVASAVSMIREDAPGKRRLVAYVVPIAGYALNSRALRDVLRVKLPNVMVPSAVVLIDQWPLTSNGKVNTKALPKPVSDHHFAAPTTYLQKRLCELWAQVLQHDRISLDDDFFDLGGDSILALTLCAKMEGIARRKITPGELYATPTIRALTSHDPEGTEVGEETIVLREGRRGGHLVALMPNLLGTGLHFNNAARLMSDGLRLITCQLPQPPLEDMDSLAAHCKDWILSQGNFESVSLVGWSFGGVLAFETARQLLLAGCPVSRLVLIDTFMTRERDCDLSIDQEFERFVAEQLQWQTEDDTGVLRQWKQNFEAHLNAFRNYIPFPLLMDVKEIRAAQPIEKETNLLPLPALTREVATSGGDHFSMWSERHLPSLVDHLNRFLLIEEQ